MSEIEAEKVWKMLFPPECYKSFFSPTCLIRVQAVIKTSRVLNPWEIFAACPHAQACANHSGMNYETTKLMKEQLERNRIQNLKIAQRGVRR